MPNYNKSEYGQLVYADLGQDISAATEFTMLLEPKVGTELTKQGADGVVLGVVNITVNDKKLIANQYITYTTKSGDLDYAGLWRVKGKAKLSATKLVVGDYENITVME